MRITVLALLWGSTFLWIKLALHDLPAGYVTAIRCALGAAVLYILCRATRSRLPRGRAIWRHIIIAALLCNAIPFALFSIGEQTVDSGVAGVLNATTPLWSLLIGLSLGTERRPRAPRIIGLALGFAGVLVIFAPWQHTNATGWGVAALLTAAASYAIAFQYMGRHLAGTGTSTISLSAAQLLAATGLTSIALPVTPSISLPVSPTGLVAMTILGVFATGITFHLTFRTIATEGATQAATVGYLLPVVSVLLGAIVLGEPVDLRVVTGMTVVLVGVALTRWRAADTTRSTDTGEPVTTAV
ncbi:MAG: DMT family transporter [Stackebrandtia sp.]